MSSKDQSPGKSENKSREKTMSSNNNSSSNDNDNDNVVDKVKVHFVAVGSAPIMKKTKFQIGADQRFAAVTAFLRKILRLQDGSGGGGGGGTGAGGSSLFLYINSAFVPGPEEVVGDLRDCFSVRGELVIHYSLQEAWG